MHKRLKMLLDMPESLPKMKFAERRSLLSSSSKESQTQPIAPVVAGHLASAPQAPSSLFREGDGNESHTHRHTPQKQSFCSPECFLIDVCGLVLFFQVSLDFSTSRRVFIPCAQTTGDSSSFGTTAAEFYCHCTKQ
jgi:hypothetical protein